MKRTIPFIIFLTIILAAGLSAQEKKPLTHDDYDGWKSVMRQQFSDNGRWLSYEVNPQHGDGWLYIKNLRNNQLDSVARGNRASFSPGSDYLAFIISPQTDVVRQARVDGKRRNELPGDSLGIVLLRDMSVTKIEGIRSFATADTGPDWMVYHLEAEGSNNASKLVVFNPMTGEKHEFADVVEYSFASNGRSVAFIQQQKNEDTEHSSVKVFNTGTKRTAELIDAEGVAKNLTVSENGRRSAFIFSSDEEEPKVYDLYHWKEGDNRASLVADRSTEGMHSGWSVSENGTLRFSDSGNRLYFGTAPIPQPEPEDTLLSDEKYSLDLWHYKDPYIQPQQLVQLRQEQRRTYTAVYHEGRSDIVQLGGKSVPEVRTSLGGDGNYALGRSILPYLKQNSFESGEYADIYLIDVNSGERTMVLEKHRGSVHGSRTGDARLSEGGKYIIYFSQADSNWHAMNAADQTSRNITAAIPYPLHDENHDTPALPGPYGIGDWVEDDRYVLIYDRFDVWKVDPSGSESPVSLTNGYGRANNIRFRDVMFDRDQNFYGRRDDVMLSAFNMQNKQSGFYTVRMHRPSNPSMIVMDEVRYFTPMKAKNDNLIVWQRSTFSEYPDLWVSNMRFANARKVSNANPQQSAYRWGTAELVEWKSFNNDKLQGILYKPEGYDPDGKYPMIVYFYERMSQNLYRYYTPSPGGSPSINVSYYVSNGYVVFVPDINPYIIGYPGHTAYNSIVSGTKMILNNYSFIDRERIGLSGQSWGGYQITYLITQTDMFAAAAAGAPVSNMFSAYGGIRWASGMSRIYQYEETQSRIGGNIWEYPLRYLENSPIFFADKINTPLFMMHNDDDGAVPWYQGIEIFMALRRLDKPVWMLNYNDEAHGVRRRPGRVDLTIRLQQFFDHYLKDEPAPVWLKYGIPAIQKGIIDGLELVE